MGMIFGLKIIHFFKNFLQYHPFSFHASNCNSIEFVDIFGIQIHIKLQQIFDIFLNQTTKFKLEDEKNT